MLDQCRTLFEFLNSHQIRYCHWKSNEHLDEALAGKTDLDVLIHIEDRYKFEEALETLNFKIIISPPEKQFPGLKDYLGFDYKTGSFIHLHVHYQLVLGQKYIKNHHLPIEKLVFENLISRNNVFIPCPELELILLIIRAHMKLDVISLAKHAIKDLSSAYYTAFPNDIEKEFSALITKSDINKFKYLLAESGLSLREEGLREFIEKFSKKQLKAYDLFKLRLTVMHDLKDFRRTKDLSIYIKYFYFVVATLPIIRRFNDIKRKRLDCAGKVMAIVGADGSGKSTLVKDLDKWLSWKLDARVYYYGIPKNVITKIASYAIRGLKNLPITGVGDFAEALFWLYVARTRRSIFFESQREKFEGKVIITDRFPLREFHDMALPMDGPRLNKNARLAASRFAKEEAKIYEDIQYPEKIIVLQVEFDELRKRKSDLSLDLHKMKAQAVNDIEASSQIELIDANKPYDDVFLKVKRIIWELL